LTGGEGTIMTVEIDLSGRRALVTGSGQGVGRAIARSLAQAGAAVAVNDIVADRVEAVVAEIRSAGGAATPLAFDLTRWDEVRAHVVGDFDILVNNAGNAGAEGWQGFADFVDTEPASWDRFIQINLQAPMYVVRAALPGMISRGWGRIVTIVSDAGRVGERGLAPYSAAKAGASGFTRAIAREVGRHGITANNVSLGTINTPDTSRGADDPALKRYVIRRFGEPSDVAGMVTFLASDRSAWVTGQTIAVNGGYSLTL
jgi:NAD(P)-dependent dehydrogenase (short-subunit alcohol dehydrogenase family)